MPRLATNYPKRMASTTRVGPRETLEFVANSRIATRKKRNGARGHTHPEAEEATNSSANHPLHTHLRRPRKQYHKAIPAVGPVRGTPLSKRKTSRHGILFSQDVRRAMTDRDLRRAVARRTVAVLPTMLTLGNVVCGFGAITFAGRWTGYDPATSLFVASCLIFLAMVFDALDGSAARRLKQTSEFGAQLDSLCDAISFGAAPALLMLQLADGYHPRILWLVAVLYVICAVLRLARFNVESGDASKADRSFCGLPSPAAAGTVASFPLMVFGLKSLDITAQDILWDGFNAWVDWVVARSLPVITLLVACLMVSRVRFPDTVRYFVRGRHNVAYLIKVVFAVAVIFVMPQFAVPLLFGWYTFSTPVVALWQRCFRPPVAIAEEVPVERPRVEEA